MAKTYLFYTHTHSHTHTLTHSHTHAHTCELPVPPHALTFSSLNIWFLICGLLLYCVLCGVRVGVVASGYNGITGGRWVIGMLVKSSLSGQSRQGRGDCGIVKYSY